MPTSNWYVTFVQLDHLVPSSISHLIFSTNRLVNVLLISQVKLCVNLHMFSFTITLKRKPFPIRMNVMIKFNTTKSKPLRLSTTHVEKWFLRMQYHNLKQMSLKLNLIVHDSVNRKGRGILIVSKSKLSLIVAHDI